MRSSWAQPSLSRDFALLSAAILFILCLISAWVTVTTYTNHSQAINDDLTKESARVEKILELEIGKADYILNALGKQIALQPKLDNVTIAHMLRAFDGKNNIFTLLSWIPPSQHIVVSSNRGILDEPVNVSDRDYVQHAAAEPWKMFVGRPIQGRVSAHWVIPVALGISDATGKYVGTVSVSIDVRQLVEEISVLVRRDGVSFALVSKDLVPLAQMSMDNTGLINNHFPVDELAGTDFSVTRNGLIKKGSMFLGTGNYVYYRASDIYPYVILIGYDTHYSDETVRSMLWSRLLQMVVMALFFVLFLWIVRSRVIRPVIDMTNIAASVAQGAPFTALPQGGPVEIEALAHQIQRVSSYIQENKRIEDELRNKMFMMKRSKEHTEIEKRSQSEFLAYVCQEMQVPLNDITGYAQVMKDQLYGPIENRKYRQYVSDIFETGNTLIDYVHGLLSLAKARTGYLEPVEKTLDVMAVVNKAVRALTDKMQARKQMIKLQAQDMLPRLSADEFRFQQMIMNLLTYAINNTPENQVLTLEAKLINENKDRLFFALTISNSDATHTLPELLALGERLLYAPPYVPTTSVAESLHHEYDINLELAKTLASMHNGAVDVTHSSEKGLVITALFGGNRVQFEYTD